MRRSSIENSEVAAAFDEFPLPLRARLLDVRDLILQTAAGLPEVGRVEEALRWGEPAYLTPETKSGSTVRLGSEDVEAGDIAIYFICTTRLVDGFKESFADTFSYAGDRAITIGPNDEIPEDELSDCIAMALTYHSRKK